jgi:diacylglycerol kinase family enzyme
VPIVNTWSHLACLQPALITPLQPGTQWIGVVNEFAGRRGETVRVAEQIADQVGSRMTLYQTAENDNERLRDISALVASKRPSLRDPLGILAFGGDRTGNDAIEGVINYLFPNRRDLLTLHPQTIVDRMLESGIQIGFVRLGGANDNGANYGAPGKDVKEIMSYMDDCQVTSLNMGLALLGDDPDPFLFCHSLSAGETIATAYEKTAEGRGMGALYKRAAYILYHVFMTQRTFYAAWRHSSGGSGQGEIHEVVVHPSVRVATSMGLPTPWVGLGTKIFIANGYTKKIGFLTEAFSRGRSSLKGDPSQLMPEERLASLDISCQPIMEVGEEMEFSFFKKAKKGWDPFEAAVAINGDFIRRVTHVRAKALPSWPRFMVREGSLMANLHARNR